MRASNMECQVRHLSNPLTLNCFIQLPSDASDFIWAACRTHLFYSSAGTGKIYAIRKKSFETAGFWRVAAQICGDGMKTASACAQSSAWAMGSGITGRKDDTGHVT